MQKIIDFNEELSKVSLKKTKGGVATREALIAQEKLYSERIIVRKRLYDDYSGNLSSDDEEVEDLIDFRLSLQSLSSLYDEI